MARGISAEEMQERVDKVRNYECPKCKGRMEIVSAQEMDARWEPGEKLRKCTEQGCQYWHYLYEDQPEGVLGELNKEQGK